MCRNDTNCAFLLVKGTVFLYAWHYANAEKERAKKWVMKREYGDR